MADKKKPVAPVKKVAAAVRASGPKKLSDAQRIDRLEQAFQRSTGRSVEDV
jgi:hypothetical protein